MSYTSTQIIHKNRSQLTSKCGADSESHLTYEHFRIHIYLFLLNIFLMSHFDTLEARLGLTLNILTVCF